MRTCGPQGTRLGWLALTLALLLFGSLACDASSPSGDSPRPSASASGTPPNPSGVPYVLPGTQGFRGNVDALTVYSAANKKTPGGCKWDQSFLFLACSGKNLRLDSVYVQGGIYWTGCGSLRITDSIIEWAPSKTWHLIQAACDKTAPGSTLEIRSSTLQTGPRSDPADPGSVPAYTGGSDIGGLNSVADRPFRIYNTLAQGFPQGFGPPGKSIIKDSEIYTKTAQCPGETCHLDGIFSQGGDGLLYQGNYIVTSCCTEPTDATAAVFYQSTPGSSGNRVIGNYLRGGAYTLYNQTSQGLEVRDNTFAGGVYGDAAVEEGGSFSVWENNTRPDGTVVPMPTSS